MITREVLAARLRDYLQHRISRAALVDWAEQVMMEGRFDERDYETVRDITSRLGVADVREFGLTWEDCDEYLARLGYRAQVDVVRAG
jgi:hypothetical protein